MIKHMGLMILLIITITFSSCSSTNSDTIIKLPKQDVKSETTYTKRLFSKVEYGNINAINSLGAAYYFGNGKTKIDKKKGLEFFKYAAANNNTYAIVNMGEIYENNGKYKKAIDNYRIGIRRGHSKANYRMGMLYFSGKGVSKNLDLSLKYLNTAQSMKNHKSPLPLGAIYELKNKNKEAIKYYKEYLLKPTNSVYNSLNLKKLLSIKIMNMYVKDKNYKEAYVWASVAVISKALEFERITLSSTEHVKSSLSDFDLKLNILKNISNKVSKEEKKELSSKIIRLNYKIFQKNYKYFYDNKLSDSFDGIIFANKSEIADINKYIIQSNANIVTYINNNTNSDSYILQMKRALMQNKIADEFMRLGAMIPLYSYALNYVKKADFNIDLNKELVGMDEDLQIRLKNLLNYKSELLEDLYKYQVNTYNNRKAKKKFNLK